VKSVFLDKWKKEELQLMLDTGNTKSKRIWESKMPPFYSKPTSIDSVLIKEQFIKYKYVKQEFRLESQNDLSKPVISKEGFLTKQGLVVKNWKKRWCVAGGTVISYYKKKGDNSPAGDIVFHNAKSIEVVNEPIKDRPYCICISTPNRNYLIQADTTEALFEWFQFLRSMKAYFNSEKGKEQSSQTIEDLDVRNITKQLSSGISIQKRKFNKKPFPNCFVGSAAVDWLFHNSALKNRNECKTFCQKLVSEGFIGCCTSTNFEDSDCLYQFLKIE